MRTRGLSGIALCVLALSAPQPVNAQGGTAIYAAQFRDLRAQMNALAARAEVLAERGTPRQKLSHQEDMQALRKLVYKLGQDAGQSNLDGMRQGREVDKTLLLVAVGVEALSLESAALDALVDTGGRSFKATARDASAIASNLEKGM